MTVEAKDERWNAPGDLFRWRNAHVKPSIGYKLWFYNLRLSRDYYLAHKQAKGRLTNQERYELPDDFHLVSETYQAFGSVWDGLFEEWWVRRGRTLFATVGTDVRADVICQVHHDRPHDSAKLNLAFAHYIEDELQTLQRPNTLIVGIPLTGHKTELLEALDRLLSDFQHVPRPRAYYSMNNTPNQHAALKNYLDLLWYKMNYPHISYWQMCMRFELSKAAKNLVARGVALPDSDMRTEMGSLTHTMYTKARMISESAARGLFPTPIELNLKEESDYEMKDRLGLIETCKALEAEQLNDKALRDAAKKLE